MSEPFQCSTLNSDLSIRAFFSITSSEKTIYLTAGSLDLVVSIFNLIVLIGVRPLKQPPSDILLVLTTFSILKTILIYITVIYDSFNLPQIATDSFESFCYATGFIEVAARSAKVVYTMILTFLYAHKVKNPLKAWATPKKEIHFVSMFLILLITLTAYFTGYIGMTIYGYCGIQFSLFSTYFIAISDLFYLLALIAASSIFLKNVYHISASSLVIKEFFAYYLCFLVVVCINQLIVTIGEFIVASACSSGSNRSLFQTNRILVNISSCTLPLFVLGIILSNRQFRRILSLKLVKGLYNRYKKWVKKLREQPEDRQIRPSFYNELLTTNRRTILLELTTLATLDQGYLSDLKDKNRACFLSSVLGCLSLQNLQIKKYVPSSAIFRTSVVDDDPSELFSWNYYETYTFTLTNSVVEYYTEIFTKKLPPVLIKFTSYSPNVLFSFAQMNHQTDLWDSLAPCNNEKEIAKDCGGGDGGSSGQFFFFNHNKTLILKTISLKERTVFLERLEYFHKHFLAHPQSLIVKMYSIVSVLNTESEDEVNFCLMGNILRGINRKYVIRSYDLKGSLYSRAVLKGKKVKQGERVAQTLKDIDFEILQSKIWISEEDASKLKKTIQADSLFLCKHGLIDYSLLVLTLDILSMGEQSPQELKILREIPHYRSLKEEGVVYIFGIIDYLQTWNIRKRSQKWYKSFFTQKDKISSQHPQFYSDRFVAFTHGILTPF